MALDGMPNIIQIALDGFYYHSPKIQHLVNDNKTYMYTRRGKPSIH